MMNLNNSNYQSQVKKLSKKWRALRLFAVVLILNGCAVGPDFKKPEAQVSTKWLESENPNVVQREEAGYSDWWTLFNDPVFNTLIETAYAQNLSLRVAGLRILEARANLGIVVGQQYPQTQEATGNLSNVGLSRNAANSAAADRNFWDFNLGFDAAWELDFWGRFRRGVESASASMGASITNYDDILVTLTAEVAQVYVQIRTLEELITVTRHNAELQQRGNEIAKAQFNAGTVTELDPMQALSLLSSTQAVVPQLEASLSQAKYSLCILLGMPPSNLYKILGDEPGFIPTTPTEVVVGIPADLLRRRPDVRTAELQAAAQSAQIGVAKADFFPRISLVGNLGFQSSANGGVSSNSSTLSKIFSAKSFTYAMGPEVQWNILSYGRIKNNVRIEDARLQESIVNYQNVVLQAAQEVESAMAGFLGAQKQIGFLNVGVKASERAAHLANLQYSAGTIDYNTVINTQTALLEQQSNWVQLRGTVAISLISVYKGLGGGWEMRKGKPFVPVKLQKEMAERTDWGSFFDKQDINLPDDLPEPPPTGKEQSLFNWPHW